MLGGGHSSGQGKGGTELCLEGQATVFRNCRKVEIKIGYSR